jgi:hypothetical protein
VAVGEVIICDMSDTDNRCGMTDEYKLTGVSLSMIETMFKILISLKIFLRKMKLIFFFI